MTVVADLDLMTLSETIVADAKNREKRECVWYYFIIQTVCIAIRIFIILYVKH